LQNGSPLWMTVLIITNTIVLQEDRPKSSQRLRIRLGWKEEGWVHGLLSFQSIER
jgi:hypothetical protein